MADNKIIRILKLLARKLKSFLYAKDVLSFLLFVALSAGFWFVNALDKTRDITIEIPIQYTNIPAEIAFTNNLPSHISVDIRDEGIHLFAYANERLKPLKLEFNEKFDDKGEMTIHATQLYKQLQTYLLTTTKINGIKPDSILIKYEKLFVKKLPVKLNGKIETEHQYMLSNTLDIKPSYINVYGPKNVLDSLREIFTEPVEIDKLNDTTAIKVKLKKHDFVKYSSNEVNVTFFVEMFTEKTVEIPVNTINFPVHLKARTFPAIVKATFNIGISHFKKYKTTDFQIVIDYNDIKQNLDSKYKLKILNNKSYINNIRLAPQEVEFILEE